LSDVLIVCGKVVEMRIIDYSKKQILDENNADGGILEKMQWHH
jgi:hypothetical protein